MLHRAKQGATADRSVAMPTDATNRLTHNEKAADPVGPAANFVA
jgi:hypothetical protein